MSEIKRKNPKRPKLEALNSVEDIKHWIPSLKKDIDFHLKQLQVPCYPERKIAEINKKIDYLKNEYQAFTKKLRKLDPSLTDVPWTERSYQQSGPEENLRKEPHHKQLEDFPTIPSAFVPIKTPILDKNISAEHSDTTVTYTDFSDLPDTMNAPLQFVKNQSQVTGLNRLNLAYSSSESEDDGNNT